MTTPIDSTSPFAGSTPASTDFKEASLGMDDFSIHTMQDDLLELQKNPALIKTTTDKEVPRKIMPTPPVSISEPQQIITETKNMMASTPTPTPQKAMNEPKNMPTEGISPFVKQTAIPPLKTRFLLL